MLILNHPITPIQWYVCTNVHTHTHACTHTRTHTCTHTHTHIHTHTHTHTYTHTCAHIQMHTDITSRDKSCFHKTVYSQNLTTATPWALLVCAGHNTTSYSTCNYIPSSVPEAHRQKCSHLGNYIGCSTVFFVLLGQGHTGMKTNISALFPECCKGTCSICCQYTP